MRRLLDQEEPFEAAFKEFIKKTDWVQETVQPKERGMHRADVLKMRIEALQKINEELLSVLELSANINPFGSNENAAARNAAVATLFKLKGKA